MSFLGNLIWIIFGGFFVFIGYSIGGLLLCITIVGIPFGLQAIKLGFVSLAPFGKKNVSTSHTGFWKLFFDIIWLIFFGWEIAVAHLASAAFFAITIIGIPFAYQHIKLIPVALFPFNQKLE